MKRIVIFTLLLGLLNFSWAQCVLDGTDGNVSDSEVESCLTSCGCSTIQITGTVSMQGSWSLASDVTITITSSGSLAFGGGGGSVEELILTTNSVIIIEGGGDLIVEGGAGTGPIRIRIGSQTFTGDDFGAIETAGGANSSGVLPVELTQFDAQSKDDMVELAWTTATELNNDFFQIEHSRDGIQFDAVGKVKGVGTTTETINYNFMHRQPASGTNYYRLKQVDFDGAYEYSDIISVEVYSRANGIRVYPNPTVDRVFIQVDKQPRDIQFALTTILGQKVDVQPATGDFGWELDLARLPNGIYVLQLDYDGKSLTKRIVKE